MAAKKNTNKLTTENFTETIKEILKEKPSSEVAIASDILSEKSLENAVKLIKIPEQQTLIEELIDKEKSKKLALLSSIFYSNKEVFSYSIANQNSLSDYKKFTQDHKCLLNDQYSNLRFYFMSLGYYFFYDATLPSKFFTSVETRSGNKLNFLKHCTALTSPFVQIDGQEGGVFKELFREIFNFSTEPWGVDYLIEVETGELVSPVTSALSRIENRLKFGQSETSKGSPHEDVFNTARKTDIKPTGDNSVIPKSIYFSDELNTISIGFGVICKDTLLSGILLADCRENRQYQNAIRELFEYNVRSSSLENLPDNLINIENYAKTPNDLSESTTKEKMMLNPCRKIIPSKECFASQTIVLPNEKEELSLKNFTADRVIKLFTDKELLIFKLAIGRAILGRSGTKVTHDKNQRISHDWRKFIVIGGLPGIGKSTLMKGIINAMDSCGFSTCAASNLKDRFGMRKTVLSDISFFDDLDQDRLVSTLKSDIFKSVITGERLVIEEKYMPKEEVIANCLLIGNMNNIDLNCLYDLDDGVKDRFVLLNAAEDNQVARQTNPYHLVKEYSTLLGVSENAIWVRVLRDCLDTTLEYCQIGEESPKAGTSLRQVVQDLSLYSKNFFDDRPGVSFLSLIFAASIYKGDEFEDILKDVNGSLRNSDRFFKSILHLIEINENPEQKKYFLEELERHFEYTKTLKSYHPHIAAKYLNFNGLSRLKQHLERGILVSGEYDPHNLLELDVNSVLSFLENKRGYIRKTYQGISRDWDEFSSNKRVLDTIRVIKAFLRQPMGENEFKDK